MGLWVFRVKRVKVREEREGVESCEGGGSYLAHNSSERGGGGGVINK